MAKSSGKNSAAAPKATLTIGQIESDAEKRIQAAESKADKKVKLAEDNAQTRIQEVEANAEKMIKKVEADAKERIDAAEAKTAELMNSAHAKPDQDDSLDSLDSIPALFVRSKADRGFRRCGYNFSHEGYLVALELLGDEKVKILTNDPELIVELVEAAHNDDRLVGAKA